MKLFDRSGKPVEVPDEQAQAALASGQYGAPAGTRIPVQYGGQVGSVPIEDLHQALSAGAEVVSDADYEKADLQAKYGDAGHKAEAFATSALGTATFGASDAVLGGLGGKDVRESIRKSQQANPISAGFGTATGIIAPVAADVLSGGAATPALAASLERAAAGTGERALARVGETAISKAAPTVLEGVLEGAPRVARVGEELQGEVLPRALPQTEGVLPETLSELSAAPKPRALPPHIADAEFEEVGEQAAHEAPEIAAETGTPPAPESPVVEEAAEQGTGVRAQRATGKGVIRTVVENSLLGPQRLVSGGGKIVEDAVRKIVGSEAETAIGRIAQKAAADAARGAFEGGAINLGQEVGHQFLQDDPDLSGERLASAWFHGALLGGAFGAGLGTLSQGSKEAISKIVGKEGISSYLLEQAGEHMWHAAGPTKAMTAEAERYAGGAAKVGNLILEDAQQLLGHSPTSKQELAELAGMMKDKHTAGLNAVLDRLDDSAFHAERPKLGDVLKDVESVIKDLRKRAAPTAELEGFAKRIVDAVPGSVDPLTGQINRNARLSFRQLRDIRVTADEMAKFNPYPGMDATPQVAAKEVRSKLEKRLMDMADTIAGDKGGTVLKDYREAKQGYQAAALLEKASARGVASEGSNQFYSLTDKLAAIPGALIGHAVAGPVGGMISHIATEHASKFIRKNFDFVVSDVLAKLANVSKGEHVLNAAQKTNERVQKRVDQGLGAVRRKMDGKEVEASAPIGGPKTYEERRETLMNAAAQHNEIADHLQNVTSPLDKAAPDVAQALKTTSLRALEYLMSALPKPPPPNPNSLTPELDAKNWKPSDPAKAQFNRKWEVATHPEIAPALIASGQLTVDHVQALQATHPKMKKDMETKLRNELEKRTKPVPPSMRSSIRLFLGVPQVDPSLGRMMQANYAVSAPKAPPKRPLKLTDHTTLNASFKP